MSRKVPKKREREPGIRLRKDARRRARAVEVLWARGQEDLARELERAETMEQALEVMNRADAAMRIRPAVDDSLCFLCQDEPPTKLLTREGEEFRMCDRCAEFTRNSIEQENRVRQALGRGRGGDIFRMTLGMNSLPTRVSVKSLI